jgi:hypothetical protein
MRKPGKQEEPKTLKRSETDSRNLGASCRCHSLGQGFVLEGD